MIKETPNENSPRILHKYIGLIFLKISVLCFFLSGCSIRFNTAKNMDVFGFNSVVNVECHIQKNDTLCGEASAEIIADYYGMTLNSDYVKKITGDAADTGGITAAGLRDLFNSSGFDTAVFQGKLDRSLQGIYRQLDLKRPVIVLLCEKPGSIGHYVVIYGYSEAKGLLAIMDPAKCSYIEKNTDFLSVWNNAKYLTILTIP